MIYGEVTRIGVRPQRGHHRGFTMTEVIVVIGLIIVLMAILLPALQAVRMQTLMASSQNNLRQVGTFMSNYSTENRETILPSRFDYRDDDVFTYKGKVCADTGIPEADRHQGTWADILWTQNALGSFPEVEPQLGHDYSTKAPDEALYRQIGDVENNPFRSEVPNTQRFVFSGTGGQPLPQQQQQVDEEGLPGFFAANDFFNARPDAPDYVTPDDTIIPTPPTGRWYTTGQIRAPERTMYLVDSFAGHWIPPTAEAFDNTVSGDGEKTIRVDFRYGGSCLMLYMDGSVTVEAAWQDLCDLEHWDLDVCDPDARTRGIRVVDPTRR